MKGSTPAPDKPSFWERRKNWFEVIGAIAVLIGIIWGAGTWIDSRARDAVTEEKFLGELAAKVRPTCVFDNKGVIEFEAGTEDYIEEIKVVPSPAIYGFEIVLRGRKHLSYPPLLSSIDTDLFSESVLREAPYGWRYKMTPISPLGSPVLSDSYPSNRTFRFKLEILH